MSHVEIENFGNRSAVSFPTFNAGVNPLVFLGLTSAGAAAIARCELNYHLSAETPAFLSKLNSKSSKSKKMSSIYVKVQKVYYIGCLRKHVKITYLLRSCKMFSESSTGCWAVLQMPCYLSKQGELSDSILQNLFNNLASQTFKYSLLREPAL